MLVLAFTPFFFAHGQAISTTPTDTLYDDLSRLTESLDLLNAIKTGKRPTNIISLQTALNNVISISEEEMRTVSLRLAALNELTSEESALRNKLMANIASFKLHVRAVRTDTTQEAGISSVISLAQKFKEWREGPYVTTMERAIALIDILENENSIQAANARLTSILKDEKKIRGMLSGTKTAAFMRLIKRAQGELKKAADLNGRAKAALLPNPKNETADDKDSIGEILRQSSNLLSATYDDFIAMSKLIKK